MIFLFLTILNFSFADQSFLKTNVKQFNWDGIKVVWVKDNELPTYRVNFYFNDGAYSEKADELGITATMLESLGFGTQKYSYRELTEKLDFMGAEYKSLVTHEYSQFSYSGLVKDLKATTQLICNMWSQPIFPEEMVSMYLNRKITQIQNIVISHGSLVDRIFREVSLGDTPYSMPMEGKIQTIKSLNSKKIAHRHKEFLKNSNMTIYITGPEEVLSIQDMISDSCPFSKGDKPSWKLALDLKESSGPKIYFVPMENANQTQIRIGRYLNYSETKEDQELVNLAYAYMGSGFNSELMQELRVRRGLTYGVGSFAGFQRDYGRLVTSTSTREEKTIETLKVIKNLFEKNAKSLDSARLSRSKNQVKGQFIMGLEASTDYLSQLIILDHANKSYSSIYEFGDKITKYSPEEVSQKIKELYQWNKQVIVVLGPEKLEKELKKLGDVKRLQISQFL